MPGIRKAIAITTALMGAVAAAWVAAPALSLTPYAPPVRDFEQALPALHAVQPAGNAQKQRGAGRDGHADRAGDGHGHDYGHGHGAGGRSTFLSPPIEAPARFDFVGIGGEMRPVSYRVRVEGGSWSAWTEVAAGDPLYARGADGVQLRTHGFRPRGRLHYVNVSGSAGGLVRRALDGARAGINSTFVAVASRVGGPSVANAHSHRPRFVMRGAWDPNGECRPAAAPSYGKIRAAVVHHTVSTNQYTRGEVRPMVLGICRFHRFGNGWSDIGYNAIADRFGNLFEARAGGLDRAVVGVHAQGFNAQTAGIAALGLHTRRGLSRRARGAIVRYLAWRLPRARRPVSGGTRLVSAGGSANRFPAGRVVRAPRITVHGRLNHTACPGNGIRRQMRGIRRRVIHRVRVVRRAARRNTARR